MKQLIRNAKLFTVFFLVLSLLMLSGLVYQQHRSQTSLWAAAGENKAALRAYYALAGSIVTRDGAVLADSEEGQRRYASNPKLAEACLQLVGDYTHIMGNTLEAGYQGELLGTGRNPFRQAWLDISGRGVRGDDLLLTLDSRLTLLAYQGLQPFRGAAVLLNYKTGEILAMASSPSTSPENVIRFRDIPDTALVNRALQGQYSPGSTFKIVTSSAFIRSPIYDPNYTVDCQAKAIIPHGARESLGHGHGIVNLSSAFAASCNIFFGEVGVRLGLDRVKEQAERFGWNQKYTLDRLPVAPSVFSCPGGDEGLLSWASIGQPVGEIHEGITPLHLALEAAAVANDGVMVKPHIIASKREPEEGRIYGAPEVETLATPLTPEQARLEQALMENAVHTGLVQAIAIQGVVVGAKSGTAEVSGQQYANGLITAYLKNDSFPLAVAVVMENAGSGAGGPLRLARSLLVQTLQYYPEGIMPQKP